MSGSELRVLIMVKLPLNGTSIERETPHKKLFDKYHLSGYAKVGGEGLNPGQ